MNILCSGHMDVFDVSNYNFTGGDRTDAEKILYRVIEGDSDVPLYVWRRWV